MSALISKEKRGIVYTFYSFKGGSGRTMALANLAVLLAKWGHSVLVVDWALEAPGLERFFSSDNAQAQTLRASKPGIIDLVQGRTNGKGLNWRDCLLEINPGQISSHLSMIS